WIAAIVTSKAGQTLGDLVPRTKEHHAPADGDNVAVTENTKLNVLAVDFGPVRALQVGNDQPPVVFLNFDMVSAHPLVVELNGISLLAADGDRQREILKDAPPV